MNGPTFTVTCARLFDGTSMRGASRISVEDGTVTSIDACSGSTDHDLLSPGFVDLQVNGWDDVDFAEASPAEMARIDMELASLGTTTYLATLVTAEKESMSARTDVLSRIGSVAPGMAGVHLEGPFLGGAPGAHRRRHIVPVDLDWIARLPANVRLVTLAAEQERASEAVSALVAKGSSVSVGHSVPTMEQFSAAVEGGASMCTHLFNAMSGVHHRDFGLALASLTDDRINVGLIADMRHVSGPAVKLAFRAKPGKVCLVSDSVGWAAAASLRSGVTLHDGAPRLPDGTLAGSSTCLADCVRRSVVEAGVDLVEALSAATSIPARVIKEDSVGRIVEGRPCDLVALDGDLRVRSVWRRLVSSRATPTDF